MRPASLLLFAALGAACGSSGPVPADAGGLDAGRGDGGSRCATDADCDDGVACTVDRCDVATGRCSQAADDGRCDDGDACTGIERCDPGLGCQAGVPLDCWDGSSCTLDRCDPLSGCVHEVRDLDGDGFASLSCEGGLDCDDDPLTGAAIHPDAEELCDDGVDNNCDGLADAFDLESCAPTNDSCETAELVDFGYRSFGYVEALQDDYDLGCDRDGEHVDLAYEFALPVGGGFRAEVLGGATALELRAGDRCALDGEALACTSEPVAPDDSALELQVSRRRDLLPPGTYHLLVSVPREEARFYSLRFTPTSWPLPDRTDRCDRFTPVITSSTSVTQGFWDVGDDYPDLACGDVPDAHVDAAFALRLEAESDVTLEVDGFDADLAPLDVRYALVESCADPNGTSLGCARSNAGVATPLVFAALPAGDYYLLVEPDDPRGDDAFRVDVTITPTAP